VLWEVAASEAEDIDGSCMSREEGGEGGWGEKQKQRNTSGFNTYPGTLNPNP
jgi:hypothetical protein